MCCTTSMHAQHHTTTCVWAGKAPMADMCVLTLAIHMHGMPAHRMEHVNASGCRAVHWCCMVTVHVVHKLAQIVHERRT